MIEGLKKLLGITPAPNYKELVSQGGIIVDVRTKGEYHGGHISNSLNIPLNELPQQLVKLKAKDKPIITCCASGIRSGQAKNILKNKGYLQVYNGGGWQSLNAKIK